MVSRSRTGWLPRLLVGGLLALAACATADDLQVVERSPDSTNGLTAKGTLAGMPVERIDLDAAVEQPAPPAASDAPAAPAGVAPTPTDRMVVQTGELVVEVARPDEAVAVFRGQVFLWKGYLQQQTGTTLVVRIPAQEFEAAWQHVHELGRVVRESRQAQDVTDEFVDLTIRIDNARKARDRLLEVMQRADKVEDVLKIEVELRRLTEEIERMEGHRKVLGEQVAMATLSVGFLASSPAPEARLRAAASRFAWINGIGAERVVEDF